MAQDTTRQDAIRYDLLVQDALRGVMRGVLADTARKGLPGEHHFYVTFNTRMPGVKLSSRMLKKYPETMNVVLQHVFWDLTVNDEFFEVGLSFGGVGEKLTVPFSAVTAFFDPSVEFGLKFELRGEPDTAAGTAPAEPKPEQDMKSRDALPAIARAPLAGRPDGGGAVQLAAARPALVAEKRTEPFAGSKDKSKDTGAPKGEVPVKDTSKVVSIDAFRKKP